MAPLVQDVPDGYFELLVKPSLQPLLVLPWGKGPFVTPAGIPNKRVQFADPFSPEVGETTVFNLLQSSPDFTDLQESRGVRDENSAYEAFCASMRTFQSYGGQGEAIALASIFLQPTRPLPFRTVLIYERDDPLSFRTTTGLAHPNLNQPRPLVRPESQLRVLSYIRLEHQGRIIESLEHYEAILPNGDLPPMSVQELENLYARGGQESYVSAVDLLPLRRRVGLVGAPTVTIERRPPSPSQTFVFPGSPTVGGAAFQLLPPPVAQREEKGKEKEAHVLGSEEIAVTMLLKILETRHDQLPSPALAEEFRQVLGQIGLSMEDGREAWLQVFGTEEG